MTCKHTDGWVVDRNQDFDIILFEGDKVEAEDIKVHCNCIDCGEVRKFDIVNGIAWVKKYD